MGIFNTLHSIITDKIYSDKDDDYSRVIASKNIYSIYDHYSHCTKHKKELDEYFNNYFTRSIYNISPNYILFPKLRSNIISALINTNNITEYKSFVEYCLVNGYLLDTKLTADEFNKDFQKIREHIIKSDLAREFINIMEVSAIITNCLGHPFGIDDLYLRLPEDYKLGVII